MSDTQFALGIALVFFYGAGIMFTFAWGHITYSVTLNYPMLPGYEWEKKNGARAMILAPVWPLFVLLTYGRRWGRDAGRMAGRVWKDAIR